MRQGFASTAMRSVMLGAAVNIALDPVFIFVLNMGVRGAALATVFSQICSTAYILRFLLGGKAAVGITRAAGQSRLDAPHRAGRSLAGAHHRAR